MSNTELIKKMEECATYAKEANEALEFVLRRMIANNKKMAEILKELEDGKKLS